MKKPSPATVRARADERRRIVQYLYRLATSAKSSGDEEAFYVLSIAAEHINAGEHR
jgi:hypothetical protein